MLIDCFQQGSSDENIYSPVKKKKKRRDYKHRTHKQRGWCLKCVLFKISICATSFHIKNVIFKKLHVTYLFNINAVVTFLISNKKDVNSLVALPSSHMSSVLVYVSLVFLHLKVVIFIFWLKSLFLNSYSVICCVTAEKTLQICLFGTSLARKSKIKCFNCSQCTFQPGQYKTNWVH